MAEFNSLEDINRVVRGIRKIEELTRSEEEMPGPAATPGTHPISVLITGPKVADDTPPFDGGLSERGMYPGKITIRNVESVSDSDKWVELQADSLSDPDPGQALVYEINDGTLEDGKRYQGKIVGFRNTKPMIEVLNSAEKVSSWKEPIRVATTSALPACTYNNGASGVGATLTANANGGLGSIDSVVMMLNYGLLVKDEVAKEHNGLFYVKDLGDATHPWILERRVDCDESLELVGATVVVEEGATNADTVWLCTADETIVVGTTQLPWTKIAPATTTATVTSSWKKYVRAATAAALPANTYANGVAGVGATLTGNANGLISAIDGLLMNLNDDILVKDEADQTKNRIYTLTQQGDASHPFILTARSDCDESSDVVGATVAVTEGTTNADTVWMCTTYGTPIIGSTNLPWTKIGPEKLTYSGNDSEGIFTTNFTALNTWVSTSAIVNIPIVGVCFLFAEIPFNVTYTGTGVAVVRIRVVNSSGVAVTPEYPVMSLTNDGVAHYATGVINKFFQNLSANDQFTVQAGLFTSGSGGFSGGAYALGNVYSRIDYFSIHGY